MKKLLSLLFIVLISNLSSFSQGIYQLWGMTIEGGSDGLGTIFTTDHNGQNLKTQHDFKRDVPGHNPAYIQLKEYAGKYYGMASGGGTYNNGVIFEWDPETNLYTSKHDFNQQDGSEPVGNLTLKDGIFYGMTSLGGNGDNGIIFEWNPQTNEFLKMQDLTPETGATPFAGLSLKDGKMYGIGFRGGAKSWGTIFEWDVELNILTKKLDLGPETGMEGYGEMVLKDGKFYGTFSDSNRGDGTIFEWNPETNEFVKKIDLYWGTGSDPYGALTYYDGKFFGINSSGGNNGFGTIFSWEPVLNIYRNEFNFSKSSGGFGSGNLTLSNGIFYGLTGHGGDNDNGTLFSWNPQTAEFIKLKDLSQNDGTNPRGSLSLRNGKLYGVTYNGGANNFGTIFEFDIDANQFTRKLSFDDREGRIPTGSLSFLNNKVYGVTSEGGANNKGTIFEFDPLSGAYSRKFDFDDEKGVTPYNGLVFRNGKFYGVTTAGGDKNYGVIYEWDPISNIYTKKYDFDYKDGACPLGLAEWHNKFYGVTSCGGENATSSSLGVIFEWDPETNIFTKKMNFELETGYVPRGNFTLKNDRFYGTTSYGGTNGFGVVYEWDPESNQFTTKNDWPLGPGYTGLTSVGENFYGLKYFGGTTDSGIIFEWEIQENRFKTLFNFDNATGAQPMTNLTHFNGKLYGTTNNGGEYGKGTIFEWQPSLQSFTRLTDLNESTGYSFFLGDLTPFPAIISKGSSNTCLLNSVIVTDSNNDQWIPVIDSNGEAIAEINANGNNLGKVDVSLYVNSGPVREDSHQQLYMDRNITITPENKTLKSGTSVDVRLYIRKSEFEALASVSNLAGKTPGITDISDIGLFKSSDNFCNAQVQQTASAITSTISAWNEDYVFTAGIQSFSTFYFASKIYSALPVKLIKLTADLQEKNAVLRWQTSEEMNLSHFEIERSINAKSFILTGKLSHTAKDSSGNYIFTDTEVSDLNAGKAYYRLKMIDTDGSFAYSSMVSLSLPFSEIITYPNPAAHILNVKLKDTDNTSWYIIDSAGRKLLIGKSTTRNFSVDLKKINPGIYHLILESGGLTRAVRFMKN